MALLEDLGGSQAGTSLSDYLMRRRQEKRIGVADERAAELHGMNMQKGEQHMKMNEQLMETRQMQNNKMAAGMADEAEERERRGQVVMFSDILERVPTGPQSQAAQLWIQLAKQGGVLRPDGKVKQGMWEDLRKDAMNDPTKSTQIASANMNHWVNASEQLKKQMSGGPEGKQPSDKEMQELQAQFQEVEQKKNMAIQSNEQLRETNAKRTKLNQEAFADLNNKSPGLGPMLIGAFGKVPNFLAMRGNPNSPEARKFKAVYEQWRTKQDIRDARDRRSRQTGKLSDFMTAYYEKKRSDPKFKDMGIAQFRNEHWSGEGGKLNEGDAIRFLADTAQYDPRKTNALTQRYQAIRKETGADRMTALNQVQKETLTIPPPQELGAELGQAGITDPESKEAVRYMKNTYMLTDKQAKKELEAFGK